MTAKWRYGLAAVVLVLLIVGIYYYIAVRNYHRKVDAIQIRNISLAAIPDGEYLGACDVDFVAAKVRVLVEDHTIAGVELLEHYNGRGESAEVIPGRIVAEQRIDVDIVTGATSSSKVIMKAVQNALTGEEGI